MITAVVAAICAFLSIIFGWGTVRAVQREDRRRARALTDPSLRTISGGYNNAWRR